jgi:predicted negative regulator of RcsB-dependent stress response
MTRTLAAAQVASVELGQTPPHAALQALETSLLTKAPSHRGGRSYLALFVAEVAASAGQVDRALSEISEALRFAEEVDERAWESELHRLRGELIGAADREAAERSFTAALEIARRQGSRSYELRAAMSLHRIQRGTKRKSALEAVRRAYATFTEGFATRDLVQAKALLERG